MMLMNKRQKILVDLIRERFDGRQTDFAMAIKRSAGQVNQWVNGHRNIGDGIARHIEMTLKLGEGFMDGKPYKGLLDPNLWEDVKEIQFKQGRIPVISYVQAGEFSEAIDIHQPGYADQWIPKYSGGDNVFALRVDGNSMTSPHGISFPEGMLVHVDPDAVCCNSGDFVVARRIKTDQVTFKQYKTDEGTPYLHPLNSDHKDIYEPFEIIGKVIFAGWSL